MKAGRQKLEAEGRFSKRADTMKIELRPLSETDGEDIFEMIQEIGLGENGFTTNFPESRKLEEIENGICRYWIEL
jgi:hypothetical protein